MRLPLVLALPALPLSMAGVLAGCGGPVFTSAASDASTTSPADAGGDVGGGSSGGGGTFCAVEAGTHTFCDDFDGPPLASKWTSIEQVGGGTAVTDLTTSYSSPGSLKTVAPASINAQTRGRVVKSFGTASRVVVSCEIWLDATPPKILPGAAVGGDSVLVVNVGSSYSIAINAHTDQVGYAEESTGGDGGTQVLSSKDLAATSTLTGWIPVALTVDLAHASLSITIGGVQRLASAPITPPSGQNVVVDVGAFSHNQTQNLAAHYDNVTIDITP
jgi:hypothetical protein